MKIGSSVIRVPSRKVGLFVRNLSTMIRSGLALNFALEGLISGEDSLDFKAVLSRVNEEILGGAKMSVAFSKFPGVFPNTLVSLVEVGEETGQVDKVLEEASDWMDRRESIKKDLASAMAYPALVLVVTLVVMFGLFWTVMPQFTAVLADLDAELPWITKFVMALTDLLRTPGPWVAAVGVAFLVKIHSPAWLQKSNVSRMLMTVPGLGPVLKFTYEARFCSALHLLTGFGIDLVRATSLAANSTGSTLMIEDSENMGRSISEGRSLSEHMKENKVLFSPITTAFFAAAEESGSLSEAAGHAAHIHMEELDLRLATFRALLVPFLVGIVAMLVAALLFSIFLPIYGSISDL